MNRATTHLILLLTTLAATSCASPTMGDLNAWFNRNVASGQEGMTFGDADRALTKVRPLKDRTTIGEIEYRFTNAMQPTTDTFSVSAANRALTHNDEHQRVLDRLSFSGLNRSINEAQQEARQQKNREQQSEITGRSDD